MMTLARTLSLLALVAAGCAAPITYDHPTKPFAEKQRDHVECMATANQAAAGAGGWSSDPAIRSAIFDNARDQYFAMCLESRGWSQGAPPPQAPALPQEGTPRAIALRQCNQQAFSGLGWYNGPLDGLPSEAWKEAVQGYMARFQLRSVDYGPQSPFRRALIEARSDQDYYRCMEAAARIGVAAK
jgi:hypothetical protein